MVRLLSLCTVLLLSVPGISRSAPEQTIVLQKPIACTLGKDCFIQQYPDHDAGPGADDYRCGVASYDGHDGTDFRIPDKGAQARGVTVLAATDGVVKAVRDGQADFAVGAFDRTKVKGIECGNGVVIDHAGGWQTQYCHMRQGSVRVKPGDTVTAGTPLGLVGQSGDAAFPHLHLSVRRGTVKVDPFAYDATGIAACSRTTQSLWRGGDAGELAYRDIEIINAGFAAAAVGTDDIERGGIARPDRHSPALVAYIRAIHLRQGDIQTLKLTGPDGTVLATTSPAIDHDKAQYQLFAGKKLTSTAWPTGTYTASYVVTRGGKTVASTTTSLVLN